MGRSAFRIVNELRTRWNEIRLKLELSQSAVDPLGAIDFELVTLLRLRGSRKNNDSASRDGSSKHDLMDSTKVDVARNLAARFNPDKCARD
jgi:hypothetical protein